jgi:broad specificity phosphatase PhoE
MTGRSKQLVLVRHGQTDWNVEERFQGQLDVPLNAVGRNQAEALKLQLAGVHFDIAYSSPLIRAVETAQIIAGNVHVDRDPRLTEIHHGFWQGKTKRDIADRWPDQWDQWNKLPQNFTAPGGESAASVRARVRDFLRTIQGTNILCVSHGVVIQTFLAILKGGPYLDHAAYVPENGSIHTLSLLEGGAQGAARFAPL